jgi:hypothetical protein
MTFASGAGVGVGAGAFVQLARIVRVARRRIVFIKNQIRINSEKGFQKAHITLHCKTLTESL